MQGYIYILKLREHIIADEDVYKAGRTKDFTKRLKGYPKLSMMLCAILVDDMVSAETELLRALTKQFKQRIELGNEYFEGPYQEIRRCIDTIADKYLPARLKQNHQNRIVQMEEECKKSVNLKSSLTMNVQLKKDTIEECKVETKPKKIIKKKPDRCKAFELLQAYMTTHYSTYDKQIIDIDNFMQALHEYARTINKVCNTLSGDNVIDKLKTFYRCKTRLNNGRLLLIFPGYETCITSTGNLWEHHLLNFIEQNCEHDPVYRVSSVEFYKAFEEYCPSETNTIAICDKSIAKFMLNKGYVKRRGRICGSSIQCFMGIRLKSDQSRSIPNN
ncbi:MAG: GIY-YIG nuclease family protein [Aphanizomenon flos-aquae Clear-A1]|nr:GIY-YIG nuclease family protein [Aphanizomenon flos-aquae Clear-A1]